MDSLTCTSAPGYLCNTAFSWSRADCKHWRGVQVVWCGSLKTLHLWDVATGTYLGQLQRGGDGEGSLELHRRFLDNSERDPRFVPRLPINSSKVLMGQTCCLVCMCIGISKGYRMGRTYILAMMQLKLMQPT